MKSYIKQMKQTAQKEYKTRHNWMEKGIHKELSKRLNFDHATKWYIQKPGPTQENET